MDKPTIKKAVEIFEEDGQAGLETWFLTLPEEEQREFIETVQKNYQVMASTAAAIMNEIESAIREAIDTVALPIENLIVALSEIFDTKADQE